MYRKWFDTIRKWCQLTISEDEKLVKYNTEENSMKIK